jgi:hypothetical protein
MSHSKQKSKFSFGIVSCFNGSVADPGYLSRIPDPDFYPSRFLDPTRATKEEGGKKFSYLF